MTAMTMTTQCNTDFTLWFFFMLRLRIGTNVCGNRSADKICDSRHLLKLYTSSTRMWLFCVFFQLGVFCKCIWLTMKIQHVFQNKIFFFVCIWLNYYQRINFKANFSKLHSMNIIGECWWKGTSKHLLQFFISGLFLMQIFVWKRIV